MKRCILLSVACFLWAVLLPVALFQDARQPPSPTPSPGAVTETVTPTPSTAPTDSAVCFSFLENGSVRTVTMAEYLPGVVAGEMPAAFDSQALRAQAVAARTYTLYQLQQNRPSHAGAAVCNDPGCCQVWLDEPVLREKWGVDYDIVLGGGFFSVRDPGSLAVGEVTYGDLYGIFPFDNELVLCTIKGKDLKEKFFETNHSSYFISYGRYGEEVRKNLDPNETYYVVVDTYTSLYGPNKLTEVARYDAGVYLRDLMAKYIATGALE